MQHATTTSIILLPSELKHYIGTLCTSSSLASLARVHSSFQKDVERVLYHTIVVCTGSKQVSCFNTLSVNPEKASFVFSLTVEFAHTSRWTDMDHVAVVSFSNALSHMHALSELRVRLPNGKIDPSPEERINNMLRGKDFQLRVLCCNDFLDIAGIIGGQLKLQFLGVYNWGGDETLLRTMRRLDARRSPLPTVFALERDSYAPFFDHLSIFPAFATSVSITSRAWTNLFDRDLARNLRMAREEVNQLSIYVRDFSDVALIHDIVETTASCFPAVSWLNFLLQRPSQIDLNIKNILSLVPELAELNFYLWDGRSEERDRSWVLPYSLKRIQAEGWTTTCPRLQMITFLDGVVLRKKDSVWGVFGH